VISLCHHFGFGNTNQGNIKGLILKVNKLLCLRELYRENLHLLGGFIRLDMQYCGYKTIYQEENCAFRSTLTTAPLNDA